MNMNYILYDQEKLLASATIEQGSPEWFAARLGKATASRIADIVATTKSGYGASRANYAAELVCERLTGTPVEKYKSAEMIWGTEKEPEARDSYCFYRDVSVEQIGFIDHPTIAMAGASPDGLVGEDGLIEIKAPNTATHLETLLGQSVPAKYTSQMQWQMACTGRRWCDFVSYDPRLPENMRLFTKRIFRDQVVIDRLEREVKLFLSEIDSTISKLREIYG